MSIRIVPKEQLGAQREKSTTAENIPPLLFANLKSLYSRRAVVCVSWRSTIRWATT